MADHSEHVLQNQEAIEQKRNAMAETKLEHLSSQTIHAANLKKQAVESVKATAGAANERIRGVIERHENMLKSQLEAAATEMSTLQKSIQEATERRNKMLEGKAKEAKTVDHSEAVQARQQGLLEQDTRKHEEHLAVLKKKLKQAQQRHEAALQQRAEQAARTQHVAKAV